MPNLSGLQALCGRLLYCTEIQGIYHALITSLRPSGGLCQSCTQVYNKNLQAKPALKSTNATLTVERYTNPAVLRNALVLLYIRIGLHDVLRQIWHL